MSDYENNDAPLLLLADDDDIFREVLSQALTRRGFEVMAAANVEEGISLAEERSPEYAVVDLNMPGGTGLGLVDYLHKLDNNTRVVVLTGYASIATAVEAIKLGAIHYLSKPADADEIITALHRDEDGDATVPVGEQPMSVRRLEWEHIQKVMAETEGNISEAARRLGMHRRTLQRKLQKKPVKK
jgi:two-component system, response regulator RegA